jgi:hypothetical protein
MEKNAVKKILCLAFVCTLAASIAVDMLAGSSYAWNQSAAVLQTTGGPAELELIDQFGFTNPWGMITSGNLAFVGQQIGKSSEVVILDLTDPQHLAVLSVISLASEDDIPDNEIAYPLGVINDILYIGVPSLVSTGWLTTPGIELYNISDATTPILIGEFSLEGEYPVKMEISGNYAYLLCNYGGIDVLDISNPTSPSLIGEFEEGPYPYPDYSALDIQGTYAYTLNGYLMIYDILNPSTPVLVSTYQPVDYRGLQDSITVDGNYAYAYAYSIYSEPAMKVFDISDPAHPVLLTEMPIGFFRVKQFITSGGLLYVVAHDGLQIFNISDPLAPQLLATYPGMEGIAAQPQEEDTAAFLDMVGFQILDTSDPSHPTRLGIHAWPQAYCVGSGNYIAASSTNLFTVRNTRSGAFLQVIDISTPGSPQVTNVLPIDSGIRGEMLISGSMLYVPTELGLQVVDITNPADLQTASLKFLAPTYITRVTVDVQSETAVVLSKKDVSWNGYQGMLSFVDVTNPLTPLLLGSFELDQDAYDVSVENQGAATIAYITTATGWLALDISNPTAPTVLFRDTTMPVEEGKSNLIDTVSQNRQTMAYLAISGDPGELVAVDVSDPANPVTRGSFSTTWAPPTFLSVEGTLVYFGTWWVDWEHKAVILVDFGRPEQPSWIGTAPLPPDWFDYASLSDDYLIAIDETDVYIFAKRGSLDGRVTDHNILPIEGVTLSLNTGAATRSDTDGLFAFPDLEFGSYTITPTLSGYSFMPSWATKDVFVSGWQSFVMLASPVSITLEPAITTTLTYTDVQGLPTTFTFLPGLVSTTTTAHITPTLVDTYYGLDFAGHAFDLALQAGGTSIYSTTFPVPVSAAIRYSPQDTAVISDTPSLALYYLEEGVWVVADGGCDPAGTPPAQEAGIYRGVICQQGTYALFGDTYAIALPQVSYGSQSSAVPPP